MQLSPLVEEAYPLNYPLHFQVRAAKTAVLFLFLEMQVSKLKFGAVSIHPAGAPASRHQAVLNNVALPVNRFSATVVRRFVHGICVVGRQVFFFDPTLPDELTALLFSQRYLPSHKKRGDLLRELMNQDGKRKVKPFFHTELSEVCRP